MGSSNRNELVKGILNDMNKFWFEASMNTGFQPQYKNLWASQTLEGDADVSNSALLNVTFNETAGKQLIQPTDPTHGRQYPGKKRRFTAKLEIERDIVDKDSKKVELRNILSTWQRAAAEKLMREKEQYYMDVMFNRAAYTSGDSIYNLSSAQYSDPSGDFGSADGKPLLALSGNNHTILGADGTYFNSLGATGAALDATNFTSAYVKLTSTNAIDEEGDRLPIIPTHLVANPAQIVEVSQILQTTVGFPGETNNGYNPYTGVVSPILSPFISSTSAWYLLANDGNFIAYDMEAPRFDLWEDKDHGVYKVSIDARYGHKILMGWNRLAGGNTPTS